MSSSAASTPIELVFIDAGVPDLDRLLNGLQEGMEAVLLTGDGDPVLQMRDALAGRSGIDAIHIVAHGEAGSVDFLGGSLSAGTIEGYAEALRDIGAALAADGDILLWSCDTGQGSVGQAFVEALSRATSADVAASDDLTGAAFLGGDWLLETTAGSVEADSPLTAAAAADYDQVLIPTKTTLLFKAGPGRVDGNALYTSDVVVGGYSVETGKAGTVVDFAPETTDGLTGELFMFDGQLYGGFTSGANGIYEGLGRFNGTEVEFLGELGTTTGDGETALGNFVVFQDDLYFTAKDESGQVQVGRFDPDSGTVGLVTDLSSGVFGHIKPAVYDGNLYFVAVNSAVVGGHAVSELMRWTGTEVEAAPGFDLYNASSLFASNGLLYVSGGTDATSTDRELWTYDGSSTAFVAEIASGVNSSYATNFTEFDGKLFFTAYVGAANSDPRLFSLENGAVTEEYDPGGYFGEVVVLNGQLYFTAGVDGTHDVDVLRYNGTGDVTQLTDLNLADNGIQRPAGLTFADGAIYFAAGPDNEREIYRVDPTTGETTQVTAIGIDGSSVAAFDPSIVVWNGNLAPLVDEARAPLAIAADGGPAAIAAALELTDLDDTSIAGATVKIVSGFAAGDVLAAVEQHGITADYDGGTGVLTLSGTATAAQYQEVMRSITLDPAGTGERAIQFQAADGDAFSSADALSGRAIVAVTAGSIADVDFATAPDGLAEESYTNAFTVSDADLGGIQFLATSSGLDIAYADLVPIADGEAYGMNYDATAQTLNVTTDWSNGPHYLVISSVNGGAFDLQGFAWADESGNSSGIVITGYRDGVQLESLRYENAWGSSLTGIVLPSDFDDVDEVRVSSNWRDNYDYALMGSFDDFLILPAEPQEAAPSLTATGADPTFIENGEAVDLFDGVVAGANDDGQSLTQLVLTVSGVGDGDAEILGIDGTDVILTDGTTTTTDLNGLSVSVAVAGDDATVTLSSGAGVSGETLASVVDGMTYRNTSDGPTGSDRIVTLTSLSDDGATNTTATLSAASTVSLTAVNDAPVLIDTAVSLAEVNQDAGPPVGAVGTLVSDLVSLERNVTDPDADAQLGIAVTAFDTSLGSWYMSLDGGTNWQAVTIPQADEALLLRGVERLYFDPAGNEARALAGITFRAWDQTAGTAGQIADVSTNGGTTAFSAATDVARLKIVDNVAPAAPSAPDLAAASDSGVSSTDDITNDTTPTFEGTAEANAIVRLYADGEEVGSATADENGNWSVTGSTLAEGVHAFTARAEDAAGNLGAASAALGVTLDATVPTAASTPDLATAADSGNSSTDEVTNATSLTFTGTAGANATVTLLIGGVDTGVSVTADDVGNYSIVYDASGLSDGDYTFSSRASDAAGNTSTASGGLTVTIDRTAAEPTPSLDAGSDSGTPGDGITSDTTPNFVGSGAEAGATVYLYADGEEIAQATVANDGIWSATGETPLASGNYAITTRQSDVAGNLSEASDSFPLKVVTNAPLVFAQTVGVTENSPSGSFVTQVGVVDLDADDTHTFALVDKLGTDEDESDAPFAIDANGEITVTGRIDYESRQTYTLRVQVTDSGGLSTERDLTVRVNDVATNDTYYGTDGDDTIAFPGTSGFDSVDGGNGTDELAVTADRMLVVGSAYLGDYLAFSLDIDKVGGYEQFLFARDIETVDLTAREIRLYGNLTHAGVGTNAIVLNGSAADNYFEAAEVTSNHAIVTHGGDGNDTLVGSVNGDTLNGDEGNDRLQGLGGPDILRGGAGMDTADYSESATGVAVSLASGQGNYGDAEGDVLSEIENITGSDHDDLLTGDSADNRLSGGGGADRVEGQGGADTLVGGAGEDTADYSSSAAGVSVSLWTGRGFYGDAQGDSLIEIENLTGTDFADHLKGDASTNVLRGGDGDDRLEGLGGGDVMIGGAGEDTADYQKSSSGVSVSLSTGLGYAGDAQGDSLAEIENLTGSSFADHLQGDGLANVLKGGADSDRLEGGGGADTLEGGAGADQLVGGDGSDTADFSLSGSGVSVSLWTGRGFYADADGDTLTRIESLRGSEFADYLKGNTVANTLRGGSGADKLEGLGGADQLEGGGGADILDGGDGTDTATYSTAAAGVSVSLWTGRGFYGDAEGDRLSGIEDLLGSAHADHLKGDAGANRLEGGAGADRLEGLGGNDVLVGGAGADRFMFGNGAGTDTILDFSAGAGLGDVMDFSGNAVLNGFSDVLAHAAQSDADTLIDLGSGDTLTLVGVDRSTLHADDFIF